jgi:hypothetical protein
VIRSGVSIAASIVALAAGAAGAAGAAPALATGGGAKPGDIAATQTYLEALHRYDRASGKGQAKVEAALQSLVGHVNEACPNVLAGAPMNNVTGEINGEILADVATALNGVGRQATLTFAKATRRLHWSDRKLTYYVQGAAAEGTANARLMAPDICTDARAMVASGFQTVPPATVRFGKEFNAANDKTKIAVKPGEASLEGLQEVILRKLKPYEVPSERAIIPPRLTKREQERAEVLGLKLVFGTAGAVANALGLPQSKTPAETAAPTQAPTA